MIITHFTDLHANKNQCINLLEICSKVKPDIIAISGDLTNWNDGDSDKPLLKQAGKWVELVNGIFPIAFCSGNHEAWTDPNEVESWNIFCKDNEAKAVIKEEDDICIISCFPWSDTGSSYAETLKEDQRLHQQHPNATRVWLHHEPAQGSACSWMGSGYSGNFYLQHLLRDYKPDFLLSGHIHCAPFVGGRAIEQMFDTTCLNPGSAATRQDEFYSPIPNYCLIDTKAKTAEWKKANAN